MKLVVCENCGAKYQLNDNEDLDSYECNICAGNLVTDGDTIPKSYNIDNMQKDKELAYCQDCGLKYRIELNENINEYECSSCGGALKYFNKAQQELADLKQQNIKTAQTPGKKDLQKLKNELEEYEEDIKNYDEVNYANEDVAETKLNEIQDQYELALYRYYGELKRKMKKEYLEHILEMPYEGGTLNQITQKFMDKIKSDNIYDSYYGSIHDYKENPDDENSGYFEKLTPKEIGLIAGTLITIVGLLSIVMINIIYSIIIIIIGVLSLYYGFRKEENVEDEEQNEDIIYTKLLTLPEDYYVLNNVKTPRINRIINNIVIGPTGIYTITNKETKTKNNSNISEKTLQGKVKNLEKQISERYNIGSDEEETEEKDNLIFKHEVLELNRDLLKFLGEKGIELPIEPLAGFINNNISIINVILDDEDLFMDELLYKIINTEKKIDPQNVKKAVVVLSQYAVR